MRSVRPMARKVGVALVVVFAVLGIMFVGMVAYECMRIENEASATTSEKREYSVGNITFSCPSDWKSTDAKDGKYIYPNIGGMVYAFRSDDINPSNGEESTMREFVEGMSRSEGGTITVRFDERSVTNDSNGTSRYVMPFSFSNDTQSLRGRILLIGDWPSIYVVMFALPDDAYAGNEWLITSVIDSVRLKQTNRNNGQTNTNRNTEAPKTSAPSNSGDNGSARVQSMTASQRNALEMAMSYLSSSAFSASGLVKQLEFEGFSEDDSKFAVARCGADWNEQAVLMARSYLSCSSFSHKGLVKQLMFEGFTREQAEYGVSATGL